MVTPHNCKVHDPSCYRCDLNRDEMHMTPLDTAAEAHAEHTTQSPPDDQDRREVLVVAIALLSDEDAMVQAVAAAMGDRRVKANAAAGYSFPPGEAARRARADALVAVSALRAHLLGGAS